MASVLQLRYVADERPDESDDVPVLSEAEDRHPEYDEAFDQEEVLALPVVLAPRPIIAFAYELGHRVQPEPRAPARTVIWRGQLKEQRPDTDWVHRVNMYRLDDGF